MFGQRRSRSRGSELNQPIAETQYLIGSSDDTPFALVIEPEGMEYEFPPHERVLLIFRPRTAATSHFELVDGASSLTIWRARRHGGVGNDG
jgi:hypothetical protein